MIKTKAKSFRGWLNGWLSTYAREDNVEMSFVFREVLSHYNHFEPEKKLEVEVKGWKGKSSFELIRQVDKLTIVKFQRKSKGQEPVEVRTEVSKEELVALIDSIKELSLSQESIPTRELACIYSEKLDLVEMFYGDFWRNFFSNRSLHNKFTLMLGAMDKLGLIEYKGGKTKLLNREIGIQLVLPSKS